MPSDLELRSPANERASLLVPSAVSNPAVPFNGSVCSRFGDDYPIEHNVLRLPLESRGRTPAQWTNFVPLTPKVYEDLWRVHSLSILTGGPFPMERETALLLQWLEPKPGGVHLDIGCSTGLYARALSQGCPEAQVVGIDISYGMLREAARKVAQEGRKVFLVQADAAALPFFSGSVDGVCMGGTLNELGKDAEKVLRECRRVLKSGGRFFSMHLLQSDTWQGRLLQEAVKLGGIRFWTRSECQEMFREAGFRNIQLETHGIVCFARMDVE